MRFTAWDNRWNDTDDRSESRVAGCLCLVPSLKVSLNYFASVCLPAQCQTLSRRWAARWKSTTSWMPSTYQVASPTSLSWLRWSRRFLRGEEAPLGAQRSQSRAPVSGAAKENSRTETHAQIRFQSLKIIDSLPQHDLIVCTHSLSGLRKN